MDKSHINKRIEFVSYAHQQVIVKLFLSFINQLISFSVLRALKRAPTLTQPHEFVCAPASRALIFKKTMCTMQFIAIATKSNSSEFEKQMNFNDPLSRYVHTTHVRVPTYRANTSQQPTWWKKKHEKNPKILMNRFSTTVLNTQTNPKHQIYVINYKIYGKKFGQSKKSTAARTHFAILLCGALQFSIKIFFICFHHFGSHKMVINHLMNEIIK